MGAINNAFNQAAGTLAGASIAIKHAQESDFSKANAAEHSALIAKNQASTAEAEANEANAEAVKKGGLVEQMTVAEANKEKADKAFDKAKNRKNASLKTLRKKNNDLFAAQNAVYELNNKWQAIVDMNNRVEEQRAYAEKATQLAKEAQQKFEKHWGGTR